MSSIHQRVALGLALVALTALAACVGPDATSVKAAPGSTTLVGCHLAPGVLAVAVVLPVHQGSDGRMPEQFRCILRAAIERGLPIRVITAEGTPTLAVKLQAKPDTVNPIAFEDDVTNAEASLVAQVNAIRASSKGNDTWGALLLAADELTSIGAGGNHGLVLSRANGNSDSGILRMTDPRMTYTEPKDVAKFIVGNDACGHVKNLTVEMYGVGQTVRPHPALSERQRAAIGKLYVNALTACGAKASSRSLPATGFGPKTKYETQPVAPDKPGRILVAPANPSKPGQQTPKNSSRPSPRRPGPETLGYVADQATFIDPVQARAVLADLARQLKDDPMVRVEIRGQTAAGPTSWTSLRALGKARADLCSRVLTNLGVDPTRISTFGDGYLATPPITDPATAAANRVTQFTFLKR